MLGFKTQEYVWIIWAYMIQYGDIVNRRNANYCNIQNHQQSVASRCVSTCFFLRRMMINDGGSLFDLFSDKQISLNDDSMDINGSNTW